MRSSDYIALMLDGLRNLSFCVDTGKGIQADRARMQKTGNCKSLNVVFEWRESGNALMIYQSNQEDCYNTDDCPGVSDNRVGIH